MPLRLSKSTETGNAMERDESSLIWKTCLRRVNDRAQLRIAVRHIRWAILVQKICSLH